MNNIAMFTLPSLPYEYNALEPFIDEMTMKIHHDKHHAAYVENLNKALEGQDEFLEMDVNTLLKKLDKVPEEIRTKVRNNAGGHANHTMFWEIMRAPLDKEEGTAPTGNFLESINSSFDSFTSFQDKFLEAALARFGSGWVWLVSDHGKLSIESTPNQDSPVMDKKSVVMGLDVWEHAYYLQYQNKRADYVKAWWSVVNWTKVAKNFEESI
jgi:Fe-Mn family superoxide dismutase